MGRQPDPCPHSPDTQGCLCHSLSVPLVNLLDVPEHNPVPATKILRHPLSCHGGHVALWEDCNGGLNKGGPRPAGERGLRQWEPWLLSDIATVGGKGWADQGWREVEGATSTTCPKSSTYIFSVSTSSLRTYLGR